MRQLWPLGYTVIPMGKKKEQHFVPQFYLRNFSLDLRKRRIALFHIPSRRHFPNASIKDQARRTWFYGRDGTVENALHGIEGNAAHTIAAMIEGAGIPATNTYEYHGLLAFIVLQKFRTQFASTDVIETINRTAAVVYGDDPRFEGLGTTLRLEHEYPALLAMNATLWVWPSLLDLRAKLLCARPPACFITSDNPVVRYNQFLEPRRPFLNNVGLFTKGLQIFFPLSPELSLVLYDSRVYRVGKKSDGEAIYTSETDVDSLNSLQMMSASSTVYCPQSTDERYLRKLLRSCKRSRILPGADVKEYRHTTDPSRSLVAISGAEIRCDLSLSCIRLHRRLRRQKPGNQVGVFRDDQMYNLLEEFEAAVKDGKFERGHFYSYLVAAGKARPVDRPRAGED